MSPHNRYAQVILPLAVEGTFTYRVTESFVHRVVVGSRVLVSFGKKRMYSAVVVSLDSAPPEGVTPKSISDVLDEEPIVTMHQIQLWNWMASYYMCTEGEVMRAALPSGLRPESESKIRINAGFPEGVRLEPDERLLYEVIRDHGELTLRDLILAGIPGKPAAILKRLVEKGAVEINEFVRRTVSRKVNRYVRIAGPYNTEKALNNLLEKVISMLDVKCSMTNAT